MHQHYLLLISLMAASALVPESIGVVGVGTISSAAVRGLCRSSNAQFVLSPRNAAKAKALEQEFESGAHRHNNQAVVDACDCVLLAVLPGQAEQVCEPLQFREGQLVISLMAGVPLSDIERWCGPAECSLACPLPAIAENAGTTIVTPPEPRTVAVFEKLGTAVPVADGRPVQAPPSDDLRDGRPLRAPENGPGLARHKRRRRDGGVGVRRWRVPHDDPRRSKRKTVDLIGPGRGADAGRHERDGHRRAKGGRRLHPRTLAAGLDLLAAVRRRPSLAPAKRGK